MAVVGCDGAEVGVVLVTPPAVAVTVAVAADVNGAAAPAVLRKSMDVGREREGVKVPSTAVMTVVVSIDSVVIVVEVRGEAAGEKESRPAALAPMMPLLGGVAAVMPPPRSLAGVAAAARRMMAAVVARSKPLRWGGSVGAGEGGVAFAG